MKIILVSPPFSGHLHPLLAIGRRISHATTFEVTVVSTSSAKERAECEGLQFCEILSGHEETIDRFANPTENIKSSPIKLFRQLRENVLLMAKMKEELKYVYLKIKPDVIIVDFTVPIAGLLARSMGIRWLTTLPSPCVFECAGVPAYMGGLLPSKTVLTTCKYKILNLFIRVVKKIFFNILKSELKDLGVDSVYDNDGYEIIYSDEKIFALGVREFEFNHPAQKRFSYIGPSLYTPKMKNLPEIRFANGKKHVLITMGTHLKFMKAKLIKSIQSLVSKYPEFEFHFTIGDENLTIVGAAKNFKMFCYVPYDIYIKNYDYVIHHGGSGILYECLRHGKPSLVFPQDFDQFDNAARLYFYNLAVWVKNWDELELKFAELIQNSQIKLSVEKFKNIVNQYDAQVAVIDFITGTHN